MRYAMVWGVMDGDGSGWIMLAPAVVGLVLRDAAHEIGTRAMRRDRHELRMVQKR